MVMELRGEIKDIKQKENIKMQFIDVRCWVRTFWQLCT